MTMLNSPEMRAVRIVAAACVAFVAAAIALGVAKKLGWIEGDLAKRAAASALGLLLVVAGNFVPKLRLLDTLRRDPGRIAQTERFAGWAFVLAGLAYVGVWAAAPIDLAIVLSSTIGLTAFAAVLLVGVRLALSPRTDAAPTDAEQDAEIAQTRVAIRVSLAAILATVMWACILFLVDLAFGDAASQTLAIVFTVLIGGIFGVWVPVALAARSRSGPQT